MAAAAASRGGTTLARRLLRWPAVGGVFAAAVACGCLPPPIDAPVEELPVGIVQHVDQVKPVERTVTLTRRAGEQVMFDVRGAFVSTAGASEPLEYVWYVDWDAGLQVDPVRQGEPFLFYVPCSELDPPPPGGGPRPDRRRVMVVVSSAPLAVPEDAYLGAAEGAAVTFHDWTIEFADTDVFKCAP